IGIAAILSADNAMREAYECPEDMYVAFARTIGLLRGGETRVQIAEARAIAKTVMLASGYRIGPEELSRRLRCTHREADEYLDLHRRKFHRFWAFSDAVIESAAANEILRTPLGWQIRPFGNDLREAKLQNWPIQSCGADILRTAVSYAVDRGLEVFAVVH